MSFEFKNHDLIQTFDYPGVLYEEVPLRGPDGKEVEQGKFEYG